MVGGVLSDLAGPRERDTHGGRRAGPRHERDGMTDRLGRADLHIHTLASDGTSGISEILEFAERNTDLDVISITDHERIDAAIAARAMARDRGLRVQVVVGEEVTTRGGHLLALYLEQPIKPLRSRRSTRRPSGGRGTDASSGSPTSSASRGSATATPTKRPQSAPAGRAF